jgi:DNA-binding CsgD family transcriptional regulator
VSPRKSDGLVDREAQVPLNGVRAEFRTALEAEIDAATRTAASGAIQLVNGRRLEGRASSFQYVFSAVSILNVPSDSPAELLVEGRDALEAIVISVEGLAVTVSVQQDLGATVPSARLRSDMAFLLRRLIKRIEETREDANPAGDRLLGAPARGEPIAIDDELLTDSQDAALGSALGRDVTFIWGPPGTGKTQTIGAIGEHLYLTGRSVLLVSHTNAAVDQALLKIARALDGQFGHGALLRLGIPSIPQLAEREDLLLDTAIRERERELRERRDDLEREKAELEQMIANADRQLEVLRWAADADSEIAKYGARLEALHRIEAEVAEREEHAAVLAGDDETERRGRVRDARLVEEAVRGVPSLEERCREVEARIGQLHHLIGRSEQAVSDAQDDVETARQIAPLLARERGLPQLAEHRAALEATAARAAAAQTELRELDDDLARESALLHATEASNALQRRLRRLPKPELQAATVRELEARRAGARARSDALGTRLDQMAPVLAELEELDARLAPHRQLGSPSQQEALLREARDRLSELATEADAARAQRAEVDEGIAEARRDADEFERLHSEPAGEVAARLGATLEELDRVRRELRTLARNAADKRTALTTDLHSRCLRLVLLRLLDEPLADAAETYIEAVALGRVEARAQAARIDVTTVRAERGANERRIDAANTEIDEIDATLAETRREVIADAAIVATTLTRAYLWDEIQNRRFDTVILDEASMAPIPALWIAALLADANVVIVGDFRQLPPIKQAEHELADRWLGRDIFDASGIRDAYEKGTPPEHFVQLDEQFRMHPDISAIANTLVYDKTLHDDPSVLNRPLGDWYRADWGPDEPVTLVDTASINAWASSVVARGRPTRVNFLSAVICVDLATKMLAAQTEPMRDGSARILIATPYRGQARLLELLLRDAQLDALVHAGTAHTFQGSEAPVVIVDLVIDEPHWRVALMIPTYDDTSRRLLNVALTRAKQRLVFVGDFNYIRKGSKKAFLGNEFLPFIEQRYRKVDATELVSVGLAARAAQAQTLVAGSAVEAGREREVMTEADVYPRLFADFAAAAERIVIFSAFITEQRVGQVLPHLRAAIERGVTVSVFTKAHEDRSKSELAYYRMLERRLSDSGITVVHKPRMHEKLVFVDAEIAWTGSLNVLSFRDTAEWMGRWESAAVFADFATPVALETVLAAYETDEARCPICEARLVPAEGTEGIYWRCEETETSGERAGKPHYTQNLDKPIPRDGMIRCARSDCDGTVEFRAGAKAPFWRCTKNIRHRQAYHPSHLRLPKMREAVIAAIGARGLRNLDLAAGVTPSPEPPVRVRPSNGDRALAVDEPETTDPVSPNGASRARQDTLFAPPATQPHGRGRPDLTPREINVLEQLALHRSRAEIASALGLQPQTVKTYVRDLNRKFGTHDRKETVRIARTLGYI